MWLQLIADTTPFWRTKPQAGSFTIPRKGDRTGLVSQTVKVRGYRLAHPRLAIGTIQEPNSRGFFAVDLSKVSGGGFGESELAIVDPGALTNPS